ncbi:RNA-directed DNA polymerase [bacterium]|nr:RNA-directed DNA polymerase [bacterium]
MQKSKEFSRDELYKAYFDCVKNKKNTPAALKFEFQLEKNLSQLYLDIIHNNYKVGKSSCIVVNRASCPREIWTGTFRDKIIHHLIRNRLIDRYYNKFISNVFNGIPKRGVLLGAMTAKCYAEDVTEQYAKKAYYLKCDISNFFNSIDKDILFNIIKRELSDESEKWLLNIIEKIIYNNPTKNIAYIPPEKIRTKVPIEKRLHYKTSKKGLPIGNLASQFFSNIYMNELDQFVVNELNVIRYCRYADDMIFFDEDVKFLNYVYEQISQFLLNELELKLNPKKKCINLIEKGFDFIGYVIKPNRILLRAKTIKKSFYQVRKWHSMPNKFSQIELEKLRSRTNGYLGLANKTNNFNYRKKLSEEVSGNLFIKPDKDYKKIIKLI